MINIAIIGNCQSTSLFHYFERCPKVNVVALLDVNCQGTEKFELSKQKLLHSDGEFDFVISQPLSDNFSEISTENLRSIYKDRFLGLTNIFFTGLHPDLSYFGGFGERIVSPLGDYHSKLALTAFAKQRSVEQCLEMYNYETYDKMGYFQAFINSKNELISRDDDNEIKFAHKFFEMTQNQLTLYAVNHPTKEVIKSLGCDILNFLNLNKMEMAQEEWGGDDYGFFYDSLISSTIWPIYTEVQKYHNLSYKTPFLFYPHLNSGQKALKIDDFVRQSYAEYEKIGYDEFMKVDLAQILRDIPL